MAIRAGGFMGDRFDMITDNPGDPAAGDAQRLTVPDNEVWQLLSISFLVTAAAGGLTRCAIVYVDSGGGVFDLHSEGAGQNPASAVNHYFTTGIQFMDSSVVANINRIWAPLTPHFFIKAGEEIIVDLINIAAGDQLSDFFMRYLQWTEA